MPKVTPIQASEHQIQTEIKNYLEGYRGYKVIRLNSGKLPSATKGKYVWLGEKGTPDLMAFKQTIQESGGIAFSDTDLLFIEVKRPGKKPTWNQEQKMQELTEYGARCIVATSIEDLEKQL